MSDVFVSYSRRDGEFVYGLAADLESRGKSVWIDTQGIGDGEVFPEAIRHAIEGADAFVFVISPESVASRYCETEVEYALGLQKRVIPVLREPVADDDLPEAIQVRNWIPYTPDVDAQEASERLVAALDLDLEHARLHTHWLVRALDWDAHARDRSFLLRGSELSAAEAWLAGVADHADPAPTALQRDYVYSSRAASNRRQRVIVTSSLVVGAIAVALAVLALISRNQAKHSATVALAQSLGADAVSEPQLDRALLLAVQGVQLSDSPLTRADLIATLLRSPRIVATYYTPSDVRPGSVAVSPDGKQVAVGEYGNSVFTFSTMKRRRLPSPSLGKNESVMALAYTPDNRRLLVLTLDGLHIFQAGTGGRGRLLPLPTGYDDSVCTRCLDVSPDGRYALTTASNSSGSAEVIRWNLGDGALDHTPFPGQVAPMLPSPDGGTIMLAGRTSHDMLLWNSDRMRVSRIVHLPGGSTAAATTNGGTTIALAQSSGTIAFLNARTGSTTAPMANGPTGATAGAFTPDGRLYVQGTAGGNLEVWDVRARTLADTDMGHSSGVQGVAVSDDGRTVYTTSLDGSVIAFDLTTRHGFGQPFAGTGRTYGSPYFSIGRNGSHVALPLQDGQVQLLSGPGLSRSSYFYGFPDHRPVGVTTFSPDGTTLGVVAGNADAGAGLPFPGASLWKISGHAPRYLGSLTGFTPGPYATVTALAFLPDGRRIVATHLYGSQNQDGEIGTFDAASGRIIGHAVKLRASSEPGALSLSPDGSRVAVGLPGGRIEVLSLPGLHELAAPRVDRSPSNNDVLSLAYSPSGATIAVGDDGGNVDLIDAHTYRPVQSSLPLVGGYVVSLAFNTNGGLLAVSGTDSSTHLVDVATWRPVVSPFPSTPDDWVTSQFLGDRLFTFSQSGAGEIWPLSLPALIGRACADAHRNLSTEEWREFLSGRSYQQTCPSA